MLETRHSALLLLGPTGSGKTPLGQCLEARGLGPTACVHFDFGQNLRDVVACNRPDAMISADDIEFLRGVLATGALLEDEHFPLAERILRSFIARRSAGPTTWVVLNGLPRHVGQAGAIDALVEIRRVVCLECPPETVILRLASNIGGDRQGRSDDRLDDVRNKLKIFARRTEPLVEHYRQLGVRVDTIRVTPESTADEVWAAIAADSLR
jgi:adenylate kinase